MPSFSEPLSRPPARPSRAVRTDPKVSPERPIGRSDGRCVQRTGTYSTRDADSRLQGIPRSRRIIAIIDPNHGRDSQDFPVLSDQGQTPAAPPSVLRVQPRTSKGMTDLLSPRASLRYVRIVPLRSPTGLRTDVGGRWPSTGGRHAPLRGQPDTIRLKKASPS